MIDFRRQPDWMGLHVKSGVAVDEDGAWLGSWYECFRCPEGASVHLERDSSPTGIAAEEKETAFDSLTARTKYRTAYQWRGRMCQRCYWKYRAEQKDEAQKKIPPPPEGPKKLGGVVGFGVNGEPIYAGKAKQ